MVRPFRIDGFVIRRRTCDMRQPPMGPSASQACREHWHGPANARAATSAGRSWTAVHRAGKLAHELGRGNPGAQATSPSIREQIKTAAAVVLDELVANPSRANGRGKRRRRQDEFVDDLLRRREVLESGFRADVRWLPGRIDDAADRSVIGDSKPNIPEFEGRAL
jgi:hypothetical protein